MTDMTAAWPDAPVPADAYPDIRSDAAVEVAVEVADRPGALPDWAARLQATPVAPELAAAALGPAPSVSGPGDAGGTGAIRGGADSPPNSLPDSLPDSPPVSPTVREAARQLPDHWLGVVDPMWPDDQLAPDWALIGSWRTDAHGDVVEWRDNDEYSPSPLALGWDDPTDDVDAAAQLAATGYGSAEELTRVLAAAEVAVLVDVDDAPVLASAPDGTAVVPVFSSDSHLAGLGALRHQIVPIAELIDLLPDDCQVYVNPTGPAPLGVEPRELRAALQELADQETDTVTAAATDDVWRPEL
jgi:hypothetical protein